MTKNLYYQFVVRQIDKKPRYFNEKKISGKSLQDCIKKLEANLNNLAKKRNQVLIKDFNNFEKRFKILKNNARCFSVAINLLKYENIL